MEPIFPHEKREPGTMGLQVLGANASLAAELLCSGWIGSLGGRSAAELVVAPEAFRMSSNNYVHRRLTRRRTEITKDAPVGD